MRTAVSLLVLIFAAPGGLTSALAQIVTVTGTISVVESARAEGGKTGNANAVVWLSPLPASSSRDSKVSVPSPRPRFKMLQHRKRFEPRVLPVLIGSIVEFPNLDPFFHNVFSLFDGKRFDLGLYEAGTSHSETFDRPGVCYVFCNIHPEMSAVIVVLETPYYAVSNQAGEFAIPSVPPGRYLVSIWHERGEPEDLSRFPREVTISAAGASLGIIRLVKAADLLSPHKNKYGFDYEAPSPPGVLYDHR